MPIVVYKHHVTVASVQEFFEEYEKMNNDPFAQIFSRNIKLGLANLAMAQIHARRCENAEPYSIYKFNYYDYDAQGILMELLLLFSEFYYKLQIFDSQYSLQNIRQYIIPHEKSYLKEQNKISFKDKEVTHSILMDQVRQTYGIVNNFYVCTDNLRFQFSSNLYTGKFIKVIPFNYSERKNKQLEINIEDYIFKSNTPSRLKLLKYRKKGFIFIIQ